MSSFTLEDKDCAIILKENNDINIILPKVEDEEAEVPENMLLAVGIVALVPTPEFQGLLSKRMAEALSGIEKKNEKEETE